jgi:hypothetical protein
VPVAVSSTITRPEELVEYLADWIEDELPEFKFVSKYDENLIPDYPCVQVQPGDLGREYHGTHTFEIFLRAFVYVMHDKLTQTKRVRSEEELKLVTKVVALLNSDLKLGGRVIEGFVESEVPMALPPASAQGSVTISTRIGWIGRNQTRFK